MDNNMEWEKMKNSKGFTLIEVLIVIGVIGIMAAIAIPSIMTWLPNYKLKSAARDVYSNLQKARSVAVKNNGNARVLFDVANNEYDLCDDWNVTTSACDGNLQTVSLTNTGYGIGYGHGNASTPVGGVFGNDVTYSVGAGDFVVFGPRGLGNASGYVYLDHRDNTSTYAIGSLTSGSIRIYKWNGSTWE